MTDNGLKFAFHYLFDGTKNCYLIGARLIGDTESLKNAVLNGNEIDMGLEQFVESGHCGGHWSDLGITRFVPAEQPNIYHTQKPFEVACPSPFSMLRATIYANNAMILRYMLSDKMEE